MREAFGRGCHRGGSPPSGLGMVPEPVSSEWPAFQRSNAATSILGGRSMKCQPRMTAPLSRDGRSISLLRAQSTAALVAGTKGGVPRFPIGRCEGTLYGARPRRLAGSVSFGTAGMRDCATPHSMRLSIGEHTQ
jgi:hypothetical protein